MRGIVRYTTVVLIALVVATVFCEYFRYPTATLVLLLRTYEQGVRKIAIVDAGGRTHERQITIGNDQGAASFYTVDLPRVQPVEVRTESLANRDRFHLDGIRLKCGDVDYKWDEYGACTKKTMPGGVIKREICTDSDPLLKVTATAQVVISRYPSITPVAMNGITIFSLLLILAALMLTGFCVISPIGHAGRAEIIAAYRGRIFYSLLTVMYLIQLAVILRYSVDVPFWEEWEYFLPDGLPKGLTWDWLFSFSGYHRVVLTKFMAWLNLHFFGLDFKLQKLINYMIYGCLLLAVVRFKNMIIGRHDFASFPLFMLFLLSPIMYENHLNSYQSQIHLVLLVALLSLFYAYDDKLKTVSVGVYLLCSFVAINTFSAGLTLVLVGYPLWSLFVLMRVKRGCIAKRKALLVLAIAGGIIAIAASSWIFGYRQPTDSVWISPLTYIFWDTFLNLLSFGFGFEVEHPLPGVVLLLVVLVPLAIVWSDKTLRTRTQVWQLTAAVLGVLAILATISITRGNLIGTSKASRYAEFGLMLIPLTAISWWLALRHAAQRGAALLLLWGICFISFFDDWSISPYRDSEQMSTFVLDTIEEYAQGRGDGMFPWSHPDPLPPFYENAKRLDVKFTRQFGSFHSGN